VFDKRDEAVASPACLIIGRTLSFLWPMGRQRLKAETLTAEISGLHLRGLRDLCVSISAGRGLKHRATWEDHPTQEIFWMRFASSTSFAVTLPPASCVLSLTTTRLYTFDQSG
jgi:hypothetical protein